MTTNRRRGRAGATAGETGRLTATEPRYIERGSEEWPAFAPAWADRVSVETAAAMPGARAYTFEREWSLPSVLREVEHFPVLTVLQTFVPTAAGEHTPGMPWLVLGAEGLWVDYRPERVADLLRSIAEALSPPGVAQRPAVTDADRGGH